MKTDRMLRIIYLAYGIGYVLGCRSTSVLAPFIVCTIVLIFWLFAVYMDNRNAELRGEVKALKRIKEKLE